MALKSDGFFDTQCMFVCEQTSLRILDVNERTLELFGTQKSELIDKTLSQIGSIVKFSGKSDKNRSEDSGTATGNVWALKVKNGKPLHVEFSSHMINYKGSPCKLIVAHDINAMVNKRKDRPSLVSSPVRLQEFPLAEIEWSPDLRILRWSDKATELFGYTDREALEDKDLMRSFVHPDDIGYVEEKLRNTLAEGKTNVSVLNRNITKGGDIISCEWYNSFLLDSEGNLVSVYSLVSDVTDRVEAMERSLRVMESYRDLFDSISDAIYLVNDNGRIIGASKGLQRTFGYSPDEVIGKHFTVLHAPGKVNPEKFYKLNEEGQLDKGGVKLGSWGKKKNGEVFPTDLLVNNGSYFGEEVQIIIERDISERKEAEEELLKRERLLSELFNTTPVGIVLLNEHHEIVEVNRGFEKIFGYEQQEIEGLELDKFIVPEPDRREASSLSSTSKITEVEARRIHKSGDLVDVMIYSVPIIIDDKLMYKYGFYVDISERKYREEEIKKSLREKEVLLSEIHHRVKNNLAVITGLLELQSYNAEDHSAHNVLKDSQMRIHSIAMVHEKLYQNERLSEIHIHKYIPELVRIVRKTMGRRDMDIELEYDLDEITLEITQAIPCGLLLNEVLTNAFKYAFEGRNSGKITIHFKHGADGEVIFGIQDNGVGFNPDEVSGSEESLGLKLISTLARQLKGKMDVKSDDGGSSFSFRFRRN